MGPEGPATGIRSLGRACCLHASGCDCQELLFSPEIVVFAADADEEGRSNAAEGLEKWQPELHTPQKLNSGCQIGPDGAQWDGGWRRRMDDGFTDLLFFKIVNPPSSEYGPGSP